MLQQKSKSYIETHWKKFNRHQTKKKNKNETTTTTTATTLAVVVAAVKLTKQPPHTAETATAAAAYQKSVGSGSGIGPSSNLNLCKFKQDMANTLSIMANVLRNVVSKKRIRYKENGFNLDLCYICDNIIAMGYPADNLESFYRNRIEDVYKFLEENHQEHYKIYNLCLERSYDINKFHGRVSVYPFEDHNPPTIELIQRFCDDVNLWLKTVGNVAAVHCKAGKGRTGTMICCYLLYSGQHSTPEEALACYDEKRTKDRKGVTIPSQRRYVQYFSKLVQSGLPYEKRSLQFYGIRFSEANHLHNQGMVNCSISVMQDTANAIKVKQLFALCIDFRKGYTLDLKDISLAVAGDIKVELTHKTSRKKIFHFWFNTFFVHDASVVEEENDSEEESKLVYTLYKNEIDDAHKDKEHKSYSEDFKVQLVFYAGPMAMDDGRTAIGQLANKRVSSNRHSKLTSDAASANASAAQQNNCAMIPQNSSSGSDLNFVFDQKSSSLSEASSKSLLADVGVATAATTATTAADAHMSEMEEQHQQQQQQSQQFVVNNSFTPNHQQHHHQPQQQLQLQQHQQQHNHQQKHPQFVAAAYATTAATVVGSQQQYQPSASFHTTNTAAAASSSRQPHNNTSSSSNRNNSSSSSSSNNSSIGSHISIAAGGGSGSDCIKDANEDDAEDWESGESNIQFTIKPKAVVAHSKYALVSYSSNTTTTTTTTTTNTTTNSKTITNTNINNSNSNNCPTLNTATPSIITSKPTSNMAKSPTSKTHAPNQTSTSATTLPSSSSSSFSSPIKPKSNASFFLHTEASTSAAAAQKASGKTTSNAAAAAAVASFFSSASSSASTSITASSPASSAAFSSSKKPQHTSLSLNLNLANKPSSSSCCKHKHLTGNVSVIGDIANIDDDDDSIDDNIVDDDDVVDDILNNVNVQINAAEAAVGVDTILNSNTKSTDDDKHKQKQKHDHDSPSQTPQIAATTTSKMSKTPKAERLLPQPAQIVTSPPSAWQQVDEQHCQFCLAEQQSSSTSTSSYASASAFHASPTEATKTLFPTTLSASDTSSSAVAAPAVISSNSEEDEAEIVVASSTSAAPASAPRHSQTFAGLTSPTRNKFFKFIQLAPKSAPAPTNATAATAADKPSSSTRVKLPFFKRKSFKTPVSPKKSAASCSSSAAGTNMEAVATTTAAVNIALNASLAAADNASAPSCKDVSPSSSSGSKQSVKNEMKKKLRRSKKFQWFQKTFRSNPDGFAAHIKDQSELKAQRRNSNSSVASRSAQHKTLPQPHLLPSIAAAVISDADSTKPAATVTPVCSSLPLNVAKSAGKMRKISMARCGSDSASSLLSVEAAADIDAEVAAVAVTHADVYDDDYYSSICDNQLSFNNSPCKSPRSLLDISGSASAVGGGKSVIEKATATATPAQLLNTTQRENVVVVAAKPARTHAIGFNVADGEADGALTETYATTTSSTLSASLASESASSSTSSPSSPPPLMNGEVDDAAETPTTASSIYSTPPLAMSSAETSPHASPFAFPRVAAAAALSSAIQAHDETKVEAEQTKAEASSEQQPKEAKSVRSGTLNLTIHTASGIRSEAENRVDAADAAALDSDASSDSPVYTTAELPQSGESCSPITYAAALAKKRFMFTDGGGSGGGSKSSSSSGICTSSEGCSSSSAATNSANSCSGGCNPFAADLERHVAAVAAAAEAKNSLAAKQSVASASSTSVDETIEELPENLSGSSAEYEPLLAGQEVASDDDELRRSLSELRRRGADEGEAEEGTSAELVTDI